MSFFILRSTNGGGGGDAQTGLLFPQNIGAPDEGSSTSFRWTGAGLVNAFPATYIWSYRPDQQTGFYTTFFWGNDGTFTQGYYGAHPYPPTGGDSGTTHKWEVSTDGFDFVTDDNANDTTVVKDGTFYQQALRVQQVGNEILCEFYWDLRNAAKIISATSSSAFASQFPPPSPALTWGTAPWRPNAENGCGVHRGIQIYSSLLSLAQIQARRVMTSDAAVVSANPGSLWYVNLNPTPSDISDKSGNGHNPSWHNSNRPDLWP